MFGVTWPRVWEGQVLSSWGQLPRDTGTSRLALGVDPRMPLQGPQVIQYELSHPLLALPKAVCPNLKGASETPWLPSS